ncbi:hypothetical protein DEO48_05415 [Enterobacter sp. CGMCC 5087]|uniref:hypothetical protein n=1 Tax=Enterobacter sp. CGMCC 5087 TaxID=2183878 RepID=UPI000D6852FB|nr:hypothetical protein [Enterobacter sp. CGMCC 5087]PWI81103.1 hypothetical protein DEO48_05415 [Enterobacter sp. CGMCC 5087]
MFKWLGFDIGMVTILFTAGFPILYLVGYYSAVFHAWRLGKDIHRHKVWVNVIMALVIGFSLGGIAQHLFDKVGTCLQLVDNLGRCILLLPEF